MTRIAIVTAGIGSSSSTRRLADRFADDLRASATAPIDIEIIEIRDHAHPIMEALVTGTLEPALADVISAVTTADGLIAITPVYNASYSGLFKSFFDVIEPSRLSGLPVLLAATGGTERHSLVTELIMRPLFTYAHAAPVSTSVYAAASDFADLARLDERIAKANREFLHTVHHAISVHGSRSTANSATIA